MRFISFHYSADHWLADMPNSVISCSAMSPALHGVTVCVLLITLSVDIHSLRDPGWKIWSDILCSTTMSRCSLKLTQGLCRGWDGGHISYVLRPAAFCKQWREDVLRQIITAVQTWWEKKRVSITSDLLFAFMPSSKVTVAYLASVTSRTTLLWPLTSLTSCLLDLFVFGSFLSRNSIDTVVWGQDPQITQQLISEVSFFS